MASLQVPRPAFGRNLMALREARGYSISQVSIILNIAALHWTRWEEGRGFPGPGTLIRICNVFGYYDLYRMMTEDVKFKGMPFHVTPITESKG